MALLSHSLKKSCLWEEYTCKRCHKTEGNFHEPKTPYDARQLYWYQCPRCNSRKIKYNIQIAQKTIPMIEEEFT